MINEYERMEAFDDDLEESDDHEIYDYQNLDGDDFVPSPQNIERAKSLVGKICVSNSNMTPMLNNLFCKVIAVNNNKRGGNLGQVKIRVYRNKQRWAPRTWKLIPNTDTYEVIDSSWLTITDQKPTVREYLLSTLSIIARIIFSEIGNEQQAFQYKWWKDGYMIPYLNPVASFVSAIYDTGRAFKYGVILK